MAEEKKNNDEKEDEEDPFGDAFNLVAAELRKYQLADPHIFKKCLDATKDFEEFDVNARVKFSDGRWVAMKNNLFDSLLIKSVYTNNNQIVGQLTVIPGINMNAIAGQDQRSALHVAVVNGFKDVVTELLDGPEIDVNLKDKHGETPLAMSMELPGTDILRALCESRAKFGPEVMEKARRDGKFLHLSLLQAYSMGSSLGNLVKDKTNDILREQAITTSMVKLLEEDTNRDFVNAFKQQIQNMVTRSLRQVLPTSNEMLCMAWEFEKEDYMATWEQQLAENDSPETSAEIDRRLREIIDNPGKRVKKKVEDIFSGQGESGPAISGELRQALITTVVTTIKPPVNNFKWKWLNKYLLESSTVWYKEVTKLSKLEYMELLKSMDGWVADKKKKRHKQHTHTPSAEPEEKTLCDHHNREWTEEEDIYMLDFIRLEFEKLHFQLAPLSESWFDLNATDGVYVTCENPRQERCVACCKERYFERFQYMIAREMFELDYEGEFGGDRQQYYWFELLLKISSRLMTRQSDGLRGILRELEKMREWDMLRNVQETTARNKREEQLHRQDRRDDWFTMIETVDEVGLEKRRVVEWRDVELEQENIAENKKMIKELGGNELLAAMGGEAEQNIISNVKRLKAVSTHSWDAVRFCDLNIYLNQLYFDANVLDPYFQNMIMKATEEMSKDLRDTFRAKDEGDLHFDYRGGPLKTLGRCLGKTEADYYMMQHPTGAHLLDINRCSITFDSPGELLEAYKWIKAKVEAQTFMYDGAKITRIARVKNGFRWVKSTLKQINYTDLKINAWTVNRRGGVSNPPVITEIQMILRPFMKAKKEMHRLYSITRQQDFMMFVVDGLKMANDDTNFFSSAQAGDSQQLGDALIDRRADANKRDFRQGAPLNYAVRSGNTRAVRLLLDSGARVNTRCPDRTGFGTFHRETSALFAAVDNGSIKCVKELCKMGGVDPNQGYIDGRDEYTPLYRAVQTNRADIVKKLLDVKGIDINLGWYKQQNKYNVDTPRAVAERFGFEDIQRMFDRKAKRSND